MHRSAAEGRFGEAEPAGRASVCAGAQTLGDKQQTKTQADPRARAWYVIRNIRIRVYIILVSQTTHAYARGRFPRASSALVGLKLLLGLDSYGVVSPLAPRQQASLSLPCLGKDLWLRAETLIRLQPSAVSLAALHSLLALGKRALRAPQMC